MQKKLITSVAFAAVALLVACGGGGYSAPGGGNGGGGGGGGGGGVSGDTIGMSLPTSSIGHENDPSWGAVGGYTQSARSQVIAFPPGTTITIKNLSSTIKHTLNVISTTSGPPANFPSNPSLSISASGGTTFGAGYASGSVNPGDSVSVTLANPGTYLVGCAYDYVNYNMRDVIEVSSSATPGPQATSPPSGGGGGY